MSQARKPIRKVKRLFVDIETSYNTIVSFNIGRKVNIPHDHIREERKIICIGYKWEGEKKVHILAWNENQDDKAMLEHFLKVHEEADEMIAHYGDGFDFKYIRTRCLFHGLPAPAEWKTVDTKAMASKFFLFNSDKLDYIASFLGFGHKIKTDWQLWVDVVEGKCPKALKRMCDYCKMDVVLLEKVYHRMREWAPPVSHAGAYNSGERWTCPRCASENVHKSKTKYTATGIIRHQMQCDECHTYYSLPDSVFNQYESRPKQKVFASAK